MLRIVAAAFVSLIAVGCVSVKALPLCYYTADMDMTKRREAITELKTALPQIFKRRFVIEGAADDLFVIVRGNNSDILKLTAIWPDIACVGHPGTTTDVFKRDACRADMKTRVLQQTYDPTKLGEGDKYLCMPLH